MKAIKGIRIFSLNEFDWWAGKDLESVKEAYQKETGLDDEEAFDECCELTDEQADSLRFHDDPYNDKDSTTRTFREQLKIMVEGGVTFPRLFALTEW